MNMVPLIMADSSDDAVQANRTYKASLTKYTKERNILSEV